MISGKAKTRIRAERADFGQNLRYRARKKLNLKRMGDNMEIIRISEGDGVVVYERVRRGNPCPKYVVVNDRTGAVLGEPRKRKGAEKLARLYRKVDRALLAEGKGGKT